MTLNQNIEQKQWKLKTRQIGAWKVKTQKEENQGLEKEYVEKKRLNKPEQWKNTIISPNILVWKFKGNEQFLHNFARFARNCAETAPSHKISTPGNLVRLRYFSQWYLTK